MRDLFERCAFVIFYALLVVLMGYSGLVMIELAVKELAK